MSGCHLSKDEDKVRCAGTGANIDPTVMLTDLDLIRECSSLSDASSYPNVKAVCDMLSLTHVKGWTTSKVSDVTITDDNGQERIGKLMSMGLSEEPQFREHGIYTYVMCTSSAQEDQEDIVCRALRSSKGDNPAERGVLREVTEGERPFNIVSYKVWRLGDGSLCKGDCQ